MPTSTAAGLLEALGLTFNEGWMHAEAPITLRIGISEQDDARQPGLLNAVSENPSTAGFRSPPMWWRGRGRGAMRRLLPSLTCLSADGENGIPALKFTTYWAQTEPTISLATPIRSWKGCLQSDLPSIHPVVLKCAGCIPHMRGSQRRDLCSFCGRQKPKAYGAKSSVGISSPARLSTMQTL